MEHLWTALFCTIHLFLGFIAGRAGRPRIEIAPALPPALFPAMAQFQHAFGQLQPALSDLPEQCQATIRELQQSVVALAAELAKAKQNSIHQAPTPVRIATPPVPAASKQESQPKKRSEKNRSAEPVGYTASEYMALFEEDLQSIADFEEVQCHDVSVSGISFFLNRHLVAGDSLLITLGQQNGGAIMTAKVTYSRPIIVRGEDRFRIGCQFLRRLSAEESADLEPLLTFARSVHSMTGIAHQR